METNPKLTANWQEQGSFTIEVTPEAVRKLRDKKVVVTDETIAGISRFEKSFFEDRIDFWVGQVTFQLPFIYVRSIKTASGALYWKNFYY